MLIIYLFMAVDDLLLLFAIPQTGGELIAVKAANSSIEFIVPYLVFGSSLIYYFQVYSFDLQDQQHFFFSVPAVCDATWSPYLLCLVASVAYVVST